MKIVLRGLAAAVLALALLAASASAATVTIRVEGTSSTLVPLTRVTTGPGQVVKDGNSAHSCDARNAVGALEQASKGDWSGPWFNGLGYSVETVHGETHSGSTSEYYNFWIDGKAAQNGVCDQTLSDGDELLLYPDCFSAGCASPSPLDVTAPTTAQRGSAFTVKAVTLDGSGGSAPAQGATVTAGDASATTGADGTATLTVPKAGTYEVRATKPGTVRSTGDQVCVHDGNDGTCGTTAPGPGGSTSTTSAQPSAAPVRDTTAPVAAITAIREGRVFAHGKGPRVLSGRVAGEAAGLTVVKLRLTRNDGGHCSYFSGKSERFRTARCGAAHGKWFAIGSKADWSYLLPSRLPAGRYVLDVNAVDKAYNRDDTRRRGSNRVVFVVR